MSAPEHQIAAVMEVLDHQDPQQPWVVRGDTETLAAHILNTLERTEADLAPDPLPSYVDCRPAFTSDDAAAIAAVLILAPVIGAAAAAIALVRRRRRKEYSS